MKNSKKRELFTVLMLMLLSLALMALIIADEAGSVPIPLDVLFVNIFLAFVGEIVIAAFTILLIICVHWYLISEHSSGRCFIATDWFWVLTPAPT